MSVRPPRRPHRRLATLVALGLAAVGTAGCAPVIVGGAAATTIAATEERGIGGAISDAEVQVTINHLWLQHSVDMLRRLNMTIDQGRVLLTGRAISPEERMDAVRLAWQAKGVKEVINEIEVGNGEGIADTAKDTWISTQLRARLVGDKYVASNNYSIVTFNQVVYLLGVAHGQTELDAASNHARSIPYVKRVVSYVRLL
ncbi:MAG TPA: BON domain-containing protein [Azospirillaceae bacterium]|nr:BON domain-containing protein [Azospirillaceae bacterium]